VAHTCNPSYSGGRDQEDRCLKPPQANSSARFYLEKTLHKNRAGGVAQSEGPEFKPQYHKKKKKKKPSCFRANILHCRVIHTVEIIFRVVYFIIDYGFLE
jgi:mRNA-degrading endonuclease RelE of RelBE toxin-antitoxin system